MTRIHASCLLAVCALLLSGCAAKPSPMVHPEMSEGGAFPNLASVPPRPTLEVSVSEREAMYHDLTTHNEAATAELPPQPETPK